MTMVRLNAFGLAADGDDVSGVAHDISTAWSTLHSALHGTAGMAGDDESAEEFAHVYDSQAKSAATSAKNLVGMLAAFETLLAGTGSAYKDAEIASAGQQGGSGIAIPSSDFAVATDLPSSLGAGWPGGWGKVEDVLQDALRAIGVQLPQGDPDKLSSAAESWNSYESSLRTASNRLSGGLAQVNAADIPQKATILAAKQTMSGHIGTAADAATGAAASLKQIKANYDQAAEEIRSMIEQLLAELAVDVGISIALSFVTFGLGALAGAANGARLVITWANRIAGVIRKLALLNKIHAEQFLKAANMLRKLEHGSFVTRFTYETVKGTISGTAAPIIVNALHGKGTSMNDIIATAAGSVVGGAFGGLGGAALSRVGRGAASEAAGTVAPTFWKATAVEGAKSAATGAVGGAAGGVTQDGLAAVMDPENHHFNVLQSLAGGTVLGTVGGATIGAGSHAVSTGWHHVTGGGHSAGGGGTVDVDVTRVDASTNVDTSSSSSAPAAPAADTGSHAPSIEQSAPVAGGNAAAAPSHAGGGDRPHIDGSQTPVVNESAQASTSAHGAGERPHIDGSQTPVVNEAAHAGSTTDGGGSHVAIDHVDAPVDHADAPAHAAESGHHEVTSTQTGTPSHDATPSHADPASDVAPSSETAVKHDAATAAGPDPVPSHVTSVDHAAASTNGAPHGSAEAHATTVDSTQHTGSVDHVDASTIRSDLSDPGTPSQVDIAATESHVTHAPSSGTDPSADPGHVPAPSNGSDGASPHHGDEPGTADGQGTVHVGMDTPTATAGTAAAATAVATHPGSAHLAGTARASGASGSGSETVPTGSGEGSSQPVSGEPNEGGRPPLRPEFPEQAVAAESRSYRGSLDAALHDHGLSRREFRRLVSKPIHRLSPEEVDTLIDIRDSVDSVQSGDVVQKIIPPDRAGQLLQAIADGETGWFGGHGIGGFIAKFAHLTGVSNHGDINPQRIFQKLGLGYDDHSFRPDGSQPLHGIRMRVGPGFDGSGSTGSNVHDRMDPLRRIQEWFDDGVIDRREWSGLSNADRHSRLIDLANRMPAGTPEQIDLQTKTLAALQPNSSKSFLGNFNPFRGNGWAGHYEHYTPEVELRDNIGLTDGAELWRYDPDGSQELVAKWDALAKKWLT
ncbi:hypothetical protein AAEP80_01730 [Curtobacterium sp. L3-7]|uniref:hypothetical protein n=1 Tax=Curtobacterium sp. L3-7 TaxID=3138787 RepID=UPI003B519069